MIQRTLGMLVVMLLLTGCGSSAIRVGDSGQKNVIANGETGDSGETGTYDADGDGWTTEAGDCDDTNSAVYPGAVEICNQVDDNCDGLVDGDPEDGTTWYLDSDGDGYGDAGEGVVVSCDKPQGYSVLPGDCNDNDPLTNPEGVEVCDSQDNNCDGEVDEASAVDAGVWFADRDGDGWGDPSLEQKACLAPTGYVGDSTDCDDSHSWVNPGEVEQCDGSSVDEDCNGLADDSDPGTLASGKFTIYHDADGDGYGDPNVSGQYCASPDSSWIGDSSDCDDTRADSYPGAVEYCDEVDTDCDGNADNNAVDAPTWYEDLDGDGYGNTDTFEACDQPSGQVASGGDCDDYDPTVYPGAEEWCDSVDQDCDGTADNDAVDATVWYADADADTYGDVHIFDWSCDQPAGYVATAGDSDDTDSSVRWSACQQILIDDDPAWVGFLWSGEYSDLVLTMSTNTATTYAHVWWWDPADASQYWAVCGFVSSLEVDLPVPELDGYYGTAWDVVGGWTPGYVVDAVREDGSYFQNTGVEVSSSMYLELVP